MPLPTDINEMQTNETVEMDSKTDVAQAQAEGEVQQKASSDSEVKKSWTATVIKAPHNELEQRKDGIWAYATVEVQDSDGDIVRVDGIDTSKFHNPASGMHMKILAQHIKMLPDGTPPIVGRVEEFKKTSTADGYKALAFFMTYAKDGSGQLTDLAKKYKDLYDGGYLDSFSIGAHSLERKQVKGAGYDYVRTALMEVSAVTIPANQRACVMRALTTFGSELDQGEVVVKMLENISEQLEKGNSAQEPKLTIEGVEKALDKCLSPLIERLDYLEAIVTKSASAPTTGDRKREISSDIQKLKVELERLSKTVK